MAAKTSKQISKPQPISGFPEWLPEQRRVEQRWFALIARIFESYGFCSLETPSVEELRILEAKGETADKEMYVLQRLAAEGEQNSDARLALHYDLTVPLARYVAQHFNDLTFPFKRYQMQRVWRGERPQEGRFREFYQCDIDVINPENIPLHFDAEIPAIIYEVLTALNVGEFQIQISNRKILAGYLSGLGVEDTAAVIRVLDKLDKIGQDGVRSTLTGELSLVAKLAERCLAIAAIKGEDDSVIGEVKALGVSSELLEVGLEELAFLLQELSALPKGVVVADLSIARGFDYYTGSIYEAKLTEYPGFGSIVAGGRYDDLASSFINKKLPGVGISIGFSRLFAKLAAEGRLEIGASSPTQVLVVWEKAENRELAINTAAKLRQRGLNVESYHAADKLKKQLRYADRKGIPYLWFIPGDIAEQHEVKNMQTREQIAADPLHWLPK